MKLHSSECDLGVPLVNRLSAYRHRHRSKSQHVLHFQSTTTNMIKESSKTHHPVNTETNLKFNNERNMCVKIFQTTEVQKK